MQLTSVPRFADPPISEADDPNVSVEKALDGIYPWMHDLEAALADLEDYTKTCARRADYGEATPATASEIAGFAALLATLVPQLAQLARAAKEASP